MNTLAQVQQSMGNAIGIRKDVLGALTEQERGVLGKLPPDSYRLFGSAVLDVGHIEDVDVAVPISDVGVSKITNILASAHGTRIHPVPLSGDLVADLHNRLSWRNACVTVDGRGTVRTGPEPADPARLEFNPWSTGVFRNLGSVLRAASKLRHAGLHAGEWELLAPAVHLGRSGDVALSKMVKTLVPDDVLLVLASHGAILAGGVFRSAAEGRRTKDVDAFVPGGGDWDGAVAALGRMLPAVPLPEKATGRVNVRKFALPGGEVLDMIDYKFVPRGEDVVSTFDFRFNMLWMDPRDSSIRGPSGAMAEGRPKEQSWRLVVEDIARARMIVGESMWYRASAYRALARWVKFSKAGYTASPEETRKYREYVELILKMRASGGGVRRDQRHNQLAMGAL